MKSKKSINRGVKGSTLVLVLIVVAVVAAVLVYMLSKIQLQLQQEVLERGTDRAEQQALSALDKLSKDVMEHPSDYEEAKEFDLSDTKLNICRTDINAPVEERCGEGSKVYVTRYSEVVKYYMKNDESIQIDVAANRHNAKLGIAIYTEAGQYRNVPDTLLIMGYKYDQGTGLKAIGECMVNYGGGHAVASPDCLGHLAVKSAYLNGPLDTATVVTQSAGAPSKYGSKIIEVIPSGDDSVAFYRIKALLADINSRFPVSVTGPVENGAPVQLPSAQVAVLTARVYSPDADKINKKIYTEYTRMIWLHPAMPETFDWVLFNGSDKPITK